MLPLSTAKEKTICALQLFVFASSIIMFSYFSNKNLPLALIFLSISQVNMIIALSGYRWRELTQVFGLVAGKKLNAWVLTCAAAGAVAAVAYRVSLLDAPFPSALQLFAGVSVLIGAGEELVFRGFLFAQLNRVNPFLRIVLCALIHGLYKVALFVGFGEVPLGRLFIYTFLVGSFLGYSRTVSKSILPCLAFHCLFDLIVYGDTANSPWWVW